MFELRKSELCDYCNIEKANPDFCVQTLSYYRNKAGYDFYMCSNDCQQKFMSEKICHRI